MALFGIFVGVLARMIIPALRKKAEADEDNPFEWQHKYTFIAALSLLVALITTLTGFLAFPIPENVTPLTFFIVAVVYGFGLDAIITELMKLTLED